MLLWRTDWSSVFNFLKFSKTFWVRHAKLSIRNIHNALPCSFVFAFQKVPVTSQFELSLKVSLLSWFSLMHFRDPSFEMFVLHLNWIELNCHTRLCLERTSYSTDMMRVLPSILAKSLEMYNMHSRLCLLRPQQFLPNHEYFLSPLVFSLEAFFLPNISIY